MELKDAKHLADEIFAQFAKTKDKRFNEILFKFDDATTKCGHCRTRFDGSGQVIPVKGYWATIVLSNRYTVHNPAKEVEETIRHESAHFLCALRNGLIKDRKGKIDSHGLKWKKVALELGAKPRSCAGEEVYIPKHLQLVCRNEKCKRKGIKVAETNQTGIWFCKCCKNQLNVEPNDMVRKQKPGMGIVIDFDNE